MFIGYMPIISAYYPMKGLFQCPRFIVAFFTLCHITQPVEFARCRIKIRTMHQQEIFAGVTINGSTCYLYMVYLCGEH